jgi:hypothetical protein
VLDATYAILSRTLRAEVAELRRKIEKPPKDAWDKVTAVSGVISALMVALIGFYATNVYTRRQQLSEQHRKDQELVVAQIQTVEKFIPHLSSSDEKIKTAGLIAIAALGNEELAVRLATAFGGSGATAALTSIVSTGGPQSVASAESALKDIFRHLQTLIATILSPTGLPVGNGVVVDNGTWIVTPYFVVAAAMGLDRSREGSDPPDTDRRVMIKLGDDERSFPGEVLNIDGDHDLAIIEINRIRLVDTSFESKPSEADIGDRVIALLSGQYGERRIEVGTVVGVARDGPMGKGRIIVSLAHVGMESAGLPIVDSKGDLVGLIYALAEAGSDTVLLVSASDVVSFLTDAIMNDAAARSQRRSRTSSPEISTG